MKNINITELNARVQAANTATVEGRQIVVNACKELYNAIEDGAEEAGIEWMCKGLYTDLCTGNFAEPFMCEVKKGDFAVAAKIYQDRIGGAQ